MKHIFLLALIGVASCKTTNSESTSSLRETQNTAFVSVDDGCHALANPGIIYGVMCLSGLNEEGIGGSGAKAAFVSQAGQEIKWCGISTKIENAEGTLVIDFTDGTKLTFSGSKNDQNVKMGQTTMGMFAAPNNFERDLNGWQESEMCQNASQRPSTGSTSGTANKAFPKGETTWACNNGNSTVLFFTTDVANSVTFSSVSIRSFSSNNPGGDDGLPGSGSPSRTVTGCKASSDNKFAFSCNDGVKLSATSTPKIGKIFPATVKSGSDSRLLECIGR